MSDLISQNLNMIFKTPKGETVHALKDLNFTIKKGELLTVLGPFWLWKNNFIKYCCRIYSDQLLEKLLSIIKKSMVQVLIEEWFFNKELYLNG